MPCFTSSVRSGVGVSHRRQLIHGIAGHRPSSQPENKAEILLHELLQWLDANDGDDLIRSGLHEALTKVVNNIHNIGEAIRTTYFDVGPQTPPTVEENGTESANRGSDAAVAEPANTCAVGVEN